MGITKVTRNWQLTLPKDVRELLKIKEGERLVISVKNNKAVIEKLEKSVIENIFGAWGKGEAGYKTVEKLRKESEIRRKRLGL